MLALGAEPSDAPAKAADADLPFGCWALRTGGWVGLVAKMSRSFMSARTNIMMIGGTLGAAMDDSAAPFLALPFSSLNTEHR